jgi:chromate reductase, NAD(P)H dehydrogenase (quinone)
MKKGVAGVVNPFMYKLHVLSASHRKESRNAQLISVALHVMQEIEPKIEVTSHPYNMYDLPLYNDAQRIAQGVPTSVHEIARWFADADMMLWSVPEYNWSYPASLKNIIDWLSCLPESPLRGKPIFLMCASPSERGGMMGLSHLKTVLDYMGMWVYPLMFGLGKVEQRLQGGALAADKQQQLVQQLSGFYRFSEKLSHNAA